MGNIQRSNFTGAVLAPQPKTLNAEASVDSRNCKPGRGDLRPWRVPLAVATAPAGTKTIYRMGRDVQSDSLYWLTWPTRVNAVHGFISGDTTERTFYTGDGPPKETDNVIGLASAPYPSAWRLLGVPAPAQMLAVTPNNTGTATDTEIRYYTYTYVTGNGKESAPAPVSNMVTCKTDDTLTIANIAAPPSGAYDIQAVRIYRTQSGTQGDTEFYFLREIPATSDTSEDDARDLGELLATDGWLPPPDTLVGLTAMWNGMVAGIVPEDGSVRYAIAYTPYAWPVALETLPPNAKAVALAVYGQRLLVLTTGKPVLVTGSSPDALDEQPLTTSHACVAAASAVGLGHGVAWAAPDGLAYVGDGGSKLVTAGILTREQWQAMRPETMSGAAFEGAYFGSYLDAGNVRRGFFIDCAAPAGIFFVDQGFETIYNDESQDALFVLDGTSIKKWDAGAALMAASDRSKEFVSPPVNMSAARVEADVYPVTLVLDAKNVDAAVIAERMAARPTLYSNPEAGVLRLTMPVAGPRPFKLPGGFEARVHQVGLTTQVGGIQSAVVATSMTELTG